MATNNTFLIAAAAGALIAAGTLRKKKKRPAKPTDEIEGGPEGLGPLFIRVAKGEEIPKDSWAGEIGGQPVITVLELGGTYEALGFHTFEDTNEKSSNSNVVGIDTTVVFDQRLGTAAIVGIVLEAKSEGDAEISYNVGPKAYRGLFRVREF